MISKHQSLHASSLIFSGIAVVSVYVLLGFEFSKFIFISVTPGSISLVGNSK